MNTNLAKTPNLITVEFQELLEIFWETHRFNSRDFFTFTCIHTLGLQKRGFLTKQDFSRAWALFVFWTFFFCFWIDWLRIKEPRFRGLYLKSKQMRYLHPKISNEAGFWHSQPRLVRRQLAKKRFSLNILSRSRQHSLKSSSCHPN